MVETIVKHNPDELTDKKLKEKGWECCSGVFFE
jgi:hypothetical protein